MQVELPMQMHLAQYNRCQRRRIMQTSDVLAGFEIFPPIAFLRVRFL
jgi:hypothetical protein